MRATTSLIALAVAFSLSACGGSMLHSDDARKELRDCRRTSDASACISVGQRFARGTEAEVDIDRASRLLTRACRLDADWGCEALGHFALFQERADVPLDRVVKFLETSCSHYNVRACYTLKLLLVRPGVTEDLERAEQLAARLCTLGFDSFCEESG